MPAERSIAPCTSTTSGAAGRARLVRPELTAPARCAARRRRRRSSGRGRRRGRPRVAAARRRRRATARSTANHTISSVESVLVHRQRLDAPRQRQRGQRARVRRQRHQPGRRPEAGHRPRRAPAARAAQDGGGPDVVGGLPGGVRDRLGDALGAGRTDGSAASARGARPTAGSCASASARSAMRAIVAVTTRPGRRRSPSPPTASRASVPSKTALATSLTSARVGSGASIIDSSICVAVITGVADLDAVADDLLLQVRHVLQRAVDAEVAAGDHHRVGGVGDLRQLARAPRWSRSWRRSAPGRRRPPAARRRRRRWRTNDSGDVVDAGRRHRLGQHRGPRRSERDSCSRSHDRCTPGRPCVRPPVSTSATTSSASSTRHVAARSSPSPSTMRSPGRRRRAASGSRRRSRAAVLGPAPGTHPHDGCRRRRSTPPSGNGPARIFGPGRSASTPIGRPSSAAELADRARAGARCSSSVPWLRFSRHTSTPARSMRSSASGSRRPADRGDDLRAPEHDRLLRSSSAVDARARSLMAMPSRLNGPRRRDLLAFLDASPSPWHAADQSAPTAGRRPVHRGRRGRVVGRRGRRPGSSCAAVRSSRGADRRRAPVGSPRRRRPHRLAGPAHQAAARQQRAGWRQLGVEVYGGVLLNSWLDRDLGVAGRLVAADGTTHAGRRRTSRSPGCRSSPSTSTATSTSGAGARPPRPPAPGVGRRRPRRATSPPGSPSRPGADDAGVRGTSCLYDVQPAAVLGADRSLLASGRLDNQVSCWAATDRARRRRARPTTSP